MDKTMMIRFFAALFLLACSVSAQTYRAVTADTNNVIRTNFTIAVQQVKPIAISDITALQSNLNNKLEFEDLEGYGVLRSYGVPISEFPAALLRTNGDGSGLTNLPNANLSNATGVLPIVSGGTGQTNASAAISALLPSYTNNAGKVLGLDNSLSLVWTNNAGGGSGSVTNVNASGGSTGLTFSGGPITSGGTLTLGGTLSIANGGTGATNASGARAALELGTAATNAASAFQPASAALTNLAAGNASGLTNLPNANLSTATGILSVSNGGSGATTSGAARTNFGLVWSGLTNADAAGFRLALSLGSAATNDAAAFQPSNANLTNLANNNGGNLTNVAVDLTTVLPAYSNNAGKVLSVASGATNVEWIAVSNTVTDASLLTNFPPSILQTSSADTNFPTFLLRTNGSAAGLTNFPQFLLQTNGNAGALTNFPIFNQNTTGTASNVTGVVAITNGGSGATTASNARANLLPSYTGNASRVLAVNGSASDVEWVVQSGGGGAVDLSTTNATGILPISKGGSGASTTNGALTNFGIITASAVTIPALTNSVSSAVVIGRSATLSGGGNVIIGDGASGGAGSGLGGAAIGRGASMTNSGIGIGYQASGNSGIAIGYQASVSSFGVALGYQATNSGAAAIGQSANCTAAGAFQLGAGTNSTTNTIQFRGSGTVNETEWSYLANASAQGGYAMTNTAGISGSKTFVAYDGTNYTTNTVTFSNGIITGWTP